MSGIKRIKGIEDVLPPDSWRWGRIEDACKSVFGAYGYDEIRIPIMERTDLFARSIGEVTDIVEKEMYTFDDRKGKSITLRPEGTAGVVRAFVEHGLGTTNPTSRFWYAGPMFRYERPQKGRQRQFYQVGCEAFGVSEPGIDAELIAMLDVFLREIGIQGIRIEVNSLGDPEDRARYRDVLTGYLRDIESQLSEDARRRIDTNPLRVLDSKADAELTADAPVILDHLSDDSRAHFAQVCEQLDRLGVKYEINKRIVRGLDYYNRTTFELIATTSLGSQNAIGGGGRYDGLVGSLGGPDIPGIGVALGMERMAIVLEDQLGPAEPPPGVYVVSLGEQALSRSLEIAQGLREAGIRTGLDYRKANMKKQLGRADRAGARYAVIIGDDELAAGQATLRRMSDGKQESVALDKLAQVVKDRFS